MKSSNSDKARRLRVRAVLAYPAVSVALVVSLALALTPFGTSQVMAVASSMIPLETVAPSPTTTTTTTTSPATPTPTTNPAPVPAPGTVPAPGAAPAPTPVTVATAPPGDHHVLARIEGSPPQANYLPVDEPVVDAQQFQTFRVRFRLHNAGTTPITTTPRLEYRSEGGGSYSVVPEDPELGVPFHVNREWVPSLGPGDGTVQSELGEDIAVADLRIGPETGFAVNGHRSMGANPDRPVTLPSDSYTEQEFTVTLSLDAQYLTGYQLRITDGGTALTGTDVATIRLGSTPPVLLSPGQRQGVAVVDPLPASGSSGSAYPLLSAQAIAANVASVPAAPAASGPDTATHPLTASTLSAATSAAAEIHGPYTLTTGQCAVCHRTHTAQAPRLLVKNSQSGLCFTCHDSLGSSTNIAGEYGDPALPPNVRSEREYYSHDATAPSNHTRSQLDEFGGLANRHSECADCHNSHKAKGAESIQTTGGWTASGRLAGVSGVSVLNGLTAGSAPTYTFLSGATDVANEDDPVTNSSPVTLEYQLCFKCHSGFTTLPPPIPNKPSKDYLDKAVELNPANASFHPVEAAGKNQTPKMQASLDGTSPYKLWNFNTTSTVRCLNCHAGGANAPEAVPPLPLPGTALAPHTSSNRGILLENYRDRVLKPRSNVVVGGVVVDRAAYNAGDFALCYVCHAEAPFRNKTTTATNFEAHGLHLTDLIGKGNGGTSIDAAGDGQGNAICSECHFRTHSTTSKVGAPGGSRLVSFAPNVKPVGTTLSWTAGTTVGTGSCTLTCHGESHDGYDYND